MRSICTTTFLPRAVQHFCQKPCTLFLSKEKRRSSLKFYYRDSYYFKVLRETLQISIHLLYITISLYTICIYFLYESNIFRIYLLCNTKKCVSLFIDFTCGSLSDKLGTRTSDFSPVCSSSSFSFRFKDDLKPHPSPLMHSRPQRGLAASSLAAFRYEQ